MTAYNPDTTSDPKRTQAMQAMQKQYDFVVCGAGSAGSVVAGRLSEDPSAQVLLIEAGGTDQVPEVLEPALWAANIGSERDWGFVAAPNPHLADRAVLMTMGKVLGGGSSVNVGLWARGHRSDWEDFAKSTDNSAWDYENILDIYRSIENWQGEADTRFRGSNGPVWVQPPADPHPIALAMLSAAEGLGVRRFASPNGLMMEEDSGCALTDLLIRHGKRHSIFRAYVHPHLHRPNLTVVTGATVRRLLIEGRRAIGVEVDYLGVTSSVRATSETIVSLGAINTPKLLMLSGIGDEVELRKHGLTILQHLPGVGKNLQDHVTFPCMWALSEPIASRHSGCEAMAYMKSQSNLETPDLLFCQVEFPYRSPEAVALGAPEHGWTILGGLARPKSRGEVRLRSADPNEMPLLDMNVLSHPEDQETAIKGLELCRILGAATTRFAKKEALPGKMDKAGLGNFLQRVAGTFHHQSCSAKMGRDAMSVVDGNLRVYGIEGLRIADASVMPRITTGNTMAPSVVIGERAAQEVRRTHRLLGP